LCDVEDHTFSRQSAHSGDEVMSLNEPTALYSPRKFLVLISARNRVDLRPPLWSSGQSSWLQIQSSRFDSRRYHLFREVVGLERCPLTLVSTKEEIRERKSSGSGLENRDYGRRRSIALTTRHLSIHKSWH
jgi:hypothetical protein